MKYLWIMGCSLVLTACGEETITYQQKQVQEGFFREASCNLEFDSDSRMDACLCEAKVSGLNVSQEQVQAALQVIEEKYTCKGDKASAPAENTRYNLLNAEARVTRDDARYFSVLYEIYSMNAGAAHGGSWREPVIFDRKTRQLIAQKDVVPEAAQGKVNALILHQLLVKNRSDYQNMLEVDKNILAKFITKNGCELCVMYPVEGGWEFAFHEYSIGPYAIGTVKLQLSDEDMGR